MKATLVLLGACALAPFAGGLAGASINTTPLEAAGSPLAAVPQHETDFGGDIAYVALDTPDHYPLVTRHGTIPVEELIFRRFGGSPPWYAASDARRYAPSAEPAAPDADDGRAVAPDTGSDDGWAQRSADIAQFPPVDPSDTAQLEPANPQLPPSARGMLTAVSGPGASAGTSESVALTQ